MVQYSKRVHTTIHVMLAGVTMQWKDITVWSKRSACFISMFSCTPTELRFNVHMYTYMVKVLCSHVLLQGEGPILCSHEPLQSKGYVYILIPLQVYKVKV